MSHLSHSPPHGTSELAIEMAHFSNAIINGGTFNSVQGDLQIINVYSESGMYNFRSVQKSVLIDDPMKVFIP